MNVLHQLFFLQWSSECNTCHHLFKLLYLTITEKSHSKCKSSCLKKKRSRLYLKYQKLVNQYLILFSIPQKCTKHNNLSSFLREIMQYQISKVIQNEKVLQLGSSIKDVHTNLRIFGTPSPCPGLSTFVWPPPPPVRSDTRLALIETLQLVNNSHWKVKKLDHSVWT